MVTFVKVDAVFQFGMALQAFLIGNFIPESMALRAVRHAFQVCMRLSQIPGGNLSVH